MKFGRAAATRCTARGCAFIGIGLPRLRPTLHAGSAASAPASIPRAARWHGYPARCTPAGVQRAGYPCHRAARGMDAGALAAEPACNVGRSRGRPIPMNAQPRAVHLVAAARPNFMKIAPLYHALSAEPWCRPVIVHTGQHYDANMSDAFFRDLRLPAPDHHLEVGSGTHAEQTGRVMIEYGAVVARAAPDCIIVVGDVN